MAPVTIVCWKWTSTQSRSSFGPETVNVLRSMVRRHYHRDVRFICVTDDTAGLDAGVEVLPDWHDFSDLPSPHGGRNPSCYRRLRMFHPDAAQWFGERFAWIDLDSVVCGDLGPILDRPEAFVSYGDTNPRPGSHYNGSLMLLTAGARRQVWERFNPKESPTAALRRGCWGSDQGWISFCLGPGEKKWGKADGVYSFRNHLQGVRTLPENARLVIFHGKHNPWDADVQRKYPWVGQHWRIETEVAA